MHGEEIIVPCTITAVAGIRAESTSSRSLCCGVAIDMRRNTLRYCALRGLLHHLPRLYRLASQIPAAVEDGDDINVPGFDPIDDAVVLKDQLSNILTVGLWNLAPDLGMFGERLHGFENLLHKSPRVVRGVLRDVRPQFPQVGTGAGRPLNGHCPTARL